MHDIVFLFDVDNTLLNNDRVQADLDVHIGIEHGAAARKRYWEIFEATARRTGLRRLSGRAANATGWRTCTIRGCCGSRTGWWTIRSPTGCIRGALDAVKHVQQWAPTVILSDGDAVFQPRKVERSGLWGAFDGHVLIYIHKEEELDDVERLYPARHYVMIDDKLRILTA